MKHFEVGIEGFRSGLSGLIRERSRSVNLVLGTELKSRIKALKSQILEVGDESEGRVNALESCDGSMKDQYELKQYLDNIIDKLLKIIEVCDKTDIGDLTFVFGNYAVGTCDSLKVSIDKFTHYIENNEIKIDSIGGINEVINLIVSFYNAICDSVNRAKGELMTRMFGSNIAINESTEEIKRSTSIDNIEGIACDLYVSIINFLICVLESYEKDSIHFCNYEIKSDYLKNKFLSLREKWPKISESENLDLDQIEPKKIEVKHLEIIKWRIMKFLADIMRNK